MDLVGEYRIFAARAAVWDALNDADVLRRCIPGCKDLEKVSDTEMTATVVAKIGPVKATFKGGVTLENLNPPESYTIVGEGKGGVAGFAKGSADVHLAEEAAEEAGDAGSGAGADAGPVTVLTYKVHAQVGGKLAQLGSRLIVSTSRKMADEFFSAFKEIVEGDGAAAGETAAGDGAATAASATAATTAATDTAEAATETQESMTERVSQSVSEAAHAVEERVEHAAEDLGKAAHEVEERVEQAAERGFLGGPMMWGLIALAGLIALLALLS
ncbi:carbon monoxide dehydrogenase subunit G [Stappia sp.]|uniref:SRPBCC family protein n=1 Tax=Stappia sp. TaxID=1870903 RepID=UPI0032D9A135